MVAGKARGEYGSQCLLVRGDTFEDMGLVARHRPDDTNVFSCVNKVDKVVINGDWGSEGPVLNRLVEIWWGKDLEFGFLV